MQIIQCIVYALKSPSLYGVASSMQYNLIASSLSIWAVINAMCTNPYTACITKQSEWHVSVLINGMIIHITLCISLRKTHNTYCKFRLARINIITVEVPLQVSSCLLREMCSRCRQAQCVFPVRLLQWVAEVPVDYKVTITTMLSDTAWTCRIKII